jgi:hypothetical protein
MPKVRIPRSTSVRTPVRAAGHPYTPTPQTRTGGSTYSGGTSLPAAAITPPPPASFIPNTPAAASLAHGTGSDLTVTWTTPAVDSTHDAASSFALRSSPEGTAAWTTVSGVASPYDLTGLAAGAGIDVELQSSNATGDSAWSATSTLTTATAGPFAPNAPAISSVMPPADGTNNKLSVVWTTPAIDGTHGAATGFNVRTSPAGAGIWTEVSGVTSPHMLTGLSGATGIDVEVQATNGAANPGAWSAVSTGTTWGATVGPGGWTAAASQAVNTPVGPSGGVQVIATTAPTAVTGVSFVWSASSSAMPTTGLIAAGADGFTNGWGQWFSAPATAGTFYLWMLAQGTGGAVIGALVSSAITVA